MQTITVLLVIISFVGCSPKVSQLDYDKLTYEHQQLEKRYALLERQKGTQPPILGNGNTAKGGTTVATVPKKTYDALEENYQALQRQKEALEASYSGLKEQLENQAIEKGKQRITTEEHNNLKEDYDNLLERYRELEAKYNKQNTITTTKKTTKKSKQVAKKAKKKAKKKQPKVVEREAPNKPKNPTIANKKTSTTPNNKGLFSEKSTTKGIEEQEEEASVITQTTKKQATIEENQESITNLDVNDLAFNFKNSQRLEDKVKMELMIVNKGKSTKLKWNVKNIQFTGNNGMNYTATDYRIGRDYASRVSGKLKKRLKSDYEVQSVFAFEEIPANVTNVSRFQIVVEIDGQDKTLEFYNVEIVPTTYKDFYDK